MQVAQLVRFVTLVLLHLGKDLAGFNPVILRRSKDGVVTLQGEQYIFIAAE